MSHVLADGGVWGGKRALDTATVALDLVTGTEAQHPMLDVAAEVNWQHAPHGRYVVEHTPQVLSLEHELVRRSRATFRE